MSDRDCNRCLYATRDGGCASWDCNFISIAEAEPKRGRWINKKSADWAGGGATLCSCCNYGYSWREFFEVENFNYCPNCGARMENADD